jgi:hypothetical protein
MRFASVPGILLASLAVLGADATSAAPSAADGQAIVAEVRKALGGEETLARIRTFSAEGTYRRIMGPRQLEGTLELVAQLPDKMRRIEDLAMEGMTGGPSIERVMTLNGDRGWDETNQRGGGGGGTVVMMRVGPGPGGPGAAGEPPSPEQMEAFRGRMLKQELERWRFALFAASDRVIAHVGTAQAPDGTADVIEIADDRG